MIWGGGLVNNTLYIARNNLKYKITIMSLIDTTIFRRGKRSTLHQREQTTHPTPFTTYPQRNCSIRSRLIDVTDIELEFLTYTRARIELAQSTNHNQDLTGEQGCRYVNPPPSPSL